jgi:DNA-binding NarL/FixJ family response regulator
MTGTARIRVLIADDQALVRGGFRLILEAQPDIEVVGEATDGVEAVELARRLRPDVVLMDVRMPRLDGIGATRRLVGLTEAAAPGAEVGIRVLILTTFDHDEYVYEAMRAGASGFLLKTVRPRQLAAAVRDVAAGDALLAPDITRRLIEQFVHRPPPGSTVPPTLGELTPRELEVLRLVARGLSNAEIATALVVGETTVRTHVTRILAKLGVRDRVQAVVAAYESGPVQPGAS